MNSFSLLPFLEDEKHRSGNECKANQIIPLQLLMQIENGKDTKNREGDHLLDRFQLSSRELSITKTISRHLKTVLQKSNEPTDQDRFPERRVFIFKMSVPRETLNHIRDR